jgi:hypothetical protein
MLIVKLSSGLGNQLFMLSFLMYLKQNTDEDIRFETSSFLRDVSGRKAELQILCSDFPVTDIKMLYNGSNRFKRLLYSSLFNNFSTARIIEDDEIYRIDKRYLKDVKYYFKGYWQSPIYVNSLKDKENIFTPNEKMPESLIPNNDLIKAAETSVALHVRRGDYFTKRYVDIYGVCTEKYFQNAVNFFSEKFESFTLFIFSDDMDWVKENLKFSNKIKVIYIENFEINSFWYIYLMSLCSHNIISNSTFSWWGAYLNKNTSKIVLSPKKWRLDTNEHLALEEWIKIDF